MRERQPVLFWDVDTQVDFMHPEGRLYVPGAEKLLPNLERLSRAAEQEGIPIVASADDHTTGDAEISDRPDFQETFPPHCISGTPGAERIEQTGQDWTLQLDLQPLTRSEIESRLANGQPRILILKRKLDAFSNPNTEVVLELLAPEQVVLYGVATDFCNRCAVEGLLERGVEVTVVTDAIEAIDPEQAQNLLADWQARGVSLRTTDEVLADLPAT